MNGEPGEVPAFRLDAPAFESRTDSALLESLAHLRLRAWAEGETDAQGALAINPLEPQSRLYLAVCRHRRGDAAGGKAEAETAGQLARTPRQRTGIVGWYYREIR